jgi:hypothetical protein
VTGPLYLGLTGGFELTGMSTGRTIILQGMGWFSLVLLALAGCQRNEFSADSKFVDLYVELKLATVGYANDLDKVNEVRRVILAQHHETSTTFHDQYIRLKAHPESWRKFQEDVIKQVENFQSTHAIGKVDSVAKVGKIDGTGKIESVKKVEKDK